jgi:molybdenum cofactor cytidylyltransferase
MTPQTTCAVVLAAGRSRRMGEGVQKLLLPLGGTTVIGRVVDALLDSDVEQVIVVAGPDGPLAGALAGRPVTVVRNPDPDADMLSSVRCGLRALPQHCDAVLVALGDQPGLTSVLVNEMLRAFPACGRGILLPTHGGRRGHPLLFSTRYRAEVLTRYEGEGLRGLLRVHPQDVFEMHTPRRAVLDDVDDPADYRRELGRTGIPCDAPEAGCYTDFMPTEVTRDALDRILEPLSRCLTPEAAKRLLELRADHEVQARVEELARKSSSGTLTAAERSEYEAYVTAGTFIAILQAKARNLLSTQTAA